MGRKDISGTGRTIKRVTLILMILMLPFIALAKLPLRPSLGHHEDNLEVKKERVLETSLKRHS